jgi:hypothetical protein
MPRAICQPRKPVQSPNSEAVRTLPIQLEYNATFGEAPTTITEAAWDNLLPVQGGFFQHPTIAPARSDFAVFHQLHCLVSENWNCATTTQNIHGPRANHRHAK